MDLYEKEMKRRKMIEMIENIAFLLFPAIAIVGLVVICTIVILGYKYGQSKKCDVVFIAGIISMVIGTALMLIFV